MSSLAVVAVVWALITASGLVGLFLKTRLPVHHTTELSRDMIGGVVGLLTLLLALVLGLLIWTAFGVFSTQQRELESIAAKALEFNLEMRHYGPQGDAAREVLREDLISAREQFWGDDRAMAGVLRGVLQGDGEPERSVRAASIRRPTRRRSCSPRRKPITARSARIGS